MPVYSGSASASIPSGSASQEARKRISAVSGRNFRNCSAAARLAEAERIKAECQNKLEEADEEIRQERAKAQQSIQQSTEDQLAQAREQARQIVSHAQTEAEHSRERILRESQRELRKLAAQATKKLAFHADPFDQFLDLAEEGEEYEE